MKKSELKNGCVVELRDGSRFLKVDNTLLNLTMTGEYAKLENYRENLLHNNNNRHDIMKVNNNVNINNDKCSVALIRVCLSDEWTWERNEEILDKDEKEYLSAVIKPFRDRVENIRKDCIGYDMYRIYITLNSITYCCLPHFCSQQNMYQGMELNKKYTLKELGL